MTSIGVKTSLQTLSSHEVSQESIDWLSSDWSHELMLSSDMLVVLDDRLDDDQDSKDALLSEDGTQFFLFACRRKCLLKWSLLMNLRSQCMQVNFFSPVWVRLCLDRSSDLANLLLQLPQSQTKGFSPKMSYNYSYYKWICSCNISWISLPIVIQNITGDSSCITNLLSICYSLKFSILEHGPSKSKPQMSRTSML